MFKFWSIYIPNNSNEEFNGHWELIPPNEKYLPRNYPKNAVRKHEEEYLPPPSYWLRPEYEEIVYTKKS